MLVLTVLLAIALEAKTLVEVADPATTPDVKVQNIQTQEINLDTYGKAVQVSGGHRVPDFLKETLFYLDLQELLKSREVLTCKPSRRSSLSCYVCEQQDNVFDYQFYFSSLDKAKCKISSYRLSFLKNSENESKIIEFLKSQNIEVTNQQIYTPMVFEKENYQIYIELIGDKYVLRFEHKDLVKLLAETEKHHYFLLNSIKKLWLQYSDITSSYLKELPIKKSIAADFLSPKEGEVIEDQAFVASWQDLKKELKTLNKEEKACVLYTNKKLLDYKVSEDLNKQIKASVKKHWSEDYSKTLNNTVCGNYYYFNLVYHFLIKTKDCSDQDAKYIKTVLLNLAKAEKNKVENDMYALMNFAYLSKNSPSDQAINKLLSGIDLELEGWPEYKKYRLKNQIDLDVGECLTKH